MSLKDKELEELVFKAIAKEGADVPAPKRTKVLCNDGSFKSDEECLKAWRLMLGKEIPDAPPPQSGGAGDGQESAPGASREPEPGGAKGKGRGSPSEAEISATLNHIYGSKETGKSSSKLTTPEWLANVDRLFPKHVKSILEQQLINRLGLKAVLQDKTLLEKVEPNMELTKMLLSNRSLLNKETEGLARRIIAKTVEDVRKKLVLQVEETMQGALRKDKHTARHIFRNLDIKRTVNKNLLHWDSKTQRLLVEKLHFYAAEKNQQPWHIIICVDQSGSMSDSLIYSCVMASIFYYLPKVKTSLVLFDTAVVDVSDKIKDPVDLLMSTQLGGGTDIRKAVSYCAGLVTDAKRTVFLLISDLEDTTNKGQHDSLRGNDAPKHRDFIDAIGDMTQCGVRSVGMGALDYNGEGRYSRENAKHLRKLGMSIVNCTPDNLGGMIGAIISKRNLPVK